LDRRKNKIGVYLTPFVGHATNSRGWPNSTKHLNGLI
jgi:hypothetical protein